MKRFAVCFCCVVTACSLMLGSLTASAAETTSEQPGAAVETEVSGETLESGGFTYELRKSSNNNNTATIKGFSQKVYAARGNTNYNTDHKLVIPSEVEGNDGTKYTVREFKIYNWKDGKENLTFTKVTIPKTLTSIESEFSGIESLQYVDFEEGSAMTYLTYDCFKDCINLERIGIGSSDKLPGGITEIGSYTFNRCVSLKSITLPEGLTGMGSGCFEGCVSLKKIVIPAGVYVLHKCFENCTSLESVVFSTYKDGENKGKSELKILNYACFKNPAIESITIPNSVESIRESAFENTPLKGINIPESCNSIGLSAFAQTKINENGLKTPDGKSYGIAFVCKTVKIDENAFNTIEYGKVINKLSPTIAGYDNSNADTYAIEHDMNFVSLGNWNPCNVTYGGDIDSDGTTDLIDVVRLQQYVNGWRDIKVNVDACDVNGDGEVNLLDVARLKQKVNGWNVPIY